jgi:sterol desaturase/sphingolipid hydroxylase (fatty acid hydroxylase superfamily)
MGFLASSLASATWPLGAVVALAADRASPAAPAAPAKDARGARGHPHATLEEHVGMQFGCVPRLVFIALVYHFVLGDWRTYAKEFAWPWVARIVLRDVLLAWITGGVEDFLLLSNSSPFRASMERHKYSAAYPRFWEWTATAPIARDVGWSTCSATIAALFEAATLHAYATGRVASGAEGDAWWRHGPTVFLMLSWFYTQNVQFYTMHRMLHPWGTKTIPDVGAFLYRHVHSLHHGAKNPTAFSGIAMHPFESTLYFSYALFPLLFGAHPLAMLYIKTNLICAAMLGHSGFESPAQGSQPHFIHHFYQNVNFAESHVPLDWLFGTFAADKEEAVRRIQERYKGSAVEAAVVKDLGAKEA